MYLITGALSIDNLTSLELFFQRNVFGEFWCGSE
jgi:hypothetical protein